MNKIIWDNEPEGEELPASAGIEIPAGPEGAQPEFLSPDELTKQNQTAPTGKVIWDNEGGEPDKEPETPAAEIAWDEPAPEEKPQGPLTMLAAPIIQGLQNAIGSIQEQMKKADPKNWSSSRLQKSMPPAETIEQKAAQEAMVADRRAKEAKVKEEMLGKIGSPAATEQADKMPRDLQGKEPRLYIEPAKAFTPMSPEQERELAIEREARWMKEFPGDFDSFEALVQGIIPYSTQGADRLEAIGRAHPLWRMGGQMAGTGIALALTGGLAPTIYQSKLIQAVPAFARFAGAKIGSTAAGFTLKGVIDDVAERVSGVDKTVGSSLRNILWDTAFGTALGGTEAIAKPLLRIPAQFALGYGSAKLQGADNLEAGLTSLLFGGLGLFNRKNLSKEFRKSIVEGFKQSTAEYLEARGRTPERSRQFAEWYFDRITARGIEEGKPLTNEFLEQLTNKARESFKDLKEFQASVKETAAKPKPAAEAKQIEGTVQEPITGKALEGRAQEPIDIRGQEVTKETLLAEATKLQEVAKVKQGTLNQVMSDISGSLQLKPKNIVHDKKGGGFYVEKGTFQGKAKSPESLVRKVMTKRESNPDYGLTSPKDHARGSIYLDSYRQVPQALEQILQRHPDAQVESTLENPLNHYGYRGVHVTFPLGDGITGELQLHTEQSWRTKIVTSDPIYRKWREYTAFKDIPTLREKINFTKDLKKSNEAWEKVAKSYPAGLSDEISSAVSRFASRTAEGAMSPPSTQAPSLNTSGLPPVSTGARSTTLPSSNLQNLNESSIESPFPSYKIIPGKESQSKSSVLFVSPSVAEGQTPEQAMKQFGTPEHTEQVMNLAKIPSGYGYRPVAWRTLGFWPEAAGQEGAEISGAFLFSEPEILKNEKYLDYFGHRMSRQFKQKAFLKWVTGGAEEDVLHFLEVPSNDPVSVYHTLRKNGLEYATMNVAGDKTMVVLYDKGGDELLAGRINKAVNALNAKHEYSLGKGDFIGKEDRQEAIAYHEQRAKELESEANIKRVGEAGEEPAIPSESDAGARAEIPAGEPSGAGRGGAEVEGAADRAINEVQAEVVEPEPARAGELGQARIASPKTPDTVKGTTAFKDPEIEARFKASQGQTRESLLTKVKDALTSLYNRATRQYELLPNDAKYAPLRRILRKQEAARQVAQDKAVRTIDAITSGLGPKRLDLFTRKVILDDLAREAESGRAVPFGYSEYDQVGNLTIHKEKLAKDKANIDAITEKNPAIKKAIERRNKVWEAIRKDLVDYEILKEEQLKDDYFRHQILEYANAKATFGTGKKLRTPSPGYAKGRKGSTYDINSNYVEAEFEVMSQALQDIQTAKHIKQIENSDLNIIKRLRDEAKDYNLTKLKAGEEPKTWHDFIPDGYRAWQPKEGNIFHTAYSVPEKIVNAALDDILSKMEVGLSDLQKVLALGGRRKEFVLPTEVADTLDNLYKARKEGFLEQAARAVTGKWKQWVLFNPRRAFKYNWQNMLGDMDATIAGQPKIFTKFPKAVKELHDVFYRGKPMSPEMREFFERGGLDSELTIQEIPELRSLDIFDRLFGEAQRKEGILDKLNIMRPYWKQVVKFTSFRESMLRYAAYLHYRDVFMNGGTEYGASVRSEVDGLANPLDKAAMVATELLGDYGALSSLGKEIRQTLIPFYSWLEINIKRYARLARNAWEEGRGAGTGARMAGLGAAKGTMFLAKWWLRAAAMTAAVMTYNQLFHGDEEKDLSPYDMNRLHITLGRDPKTGEVIILRGQSAFADVLEWFGLDQFPTLMRDYFDGKASLADIFGKVPLVTGKVGLKPIAMKFIRGITPVYKIPFETLTGKTLPVFDERSGRVEDKIRNIMRAVSLENEYDLVKQNPSRGYWRSLGEAFITRTNPEENAYNYIQGEKYKFLETVKGKGGSGDYYSQKSLLYRQYKKALRFKDEAAEKRILGELSKLGVSQKDLNQSVETMHPLHGLSKDDRKEFLQGYLSERDRSLLKRAEKYYFETFRYPKRD